MAPPWYASTEWEGMGQATLHFRSKRKSTHPMETHQIDCYLSAVYIREYGEKKQPVEENETREPQSDLKPPGIPPELWNAWKEHWEAWKEVLIPLSWVHKYRAHCTPEYIKWHDSYLEDYPEVLPLVTDNLGRNDLSEDTTKPSLENKTCQFDGKDNQNSSELKEIVVGCAETAVEKKCKSGEPGSENNKGATKPSSDNKNYHSIDEVDLSEFYDDIYSNETVETSQNCLEGKTAKNYVAGENLQECASEGIAGVDAVTDTAKEKTEEKRKKMLDELYEKHTKSRYWVHLHSFLYTSGIECNPEIELFFEKKAGIKFGIPPSGESCSSMTKDTEESGCAEFDESCSVEGGDPSGEKHFQGRSEPSLKERKSTTQENYTSSNCNKHENYLGSLQDGTHNDSKERQKQMENAKQNPGERSAEALTTKERFQSSSYVPQEAGSGSNSGNSSNEGNNTESGGLTGERANSSGDEGGNVQTMESLTVNSASASVNKKQKVAKKRRQKCMTRPQGLSWALEYVQQKESKKAEIQGIPETTSLSLELQEVTLESPEASCGPNENVIEESGRHLSMSATESSESASSDTDENGYAVADFLDEIELQEVTLESPEASCEPNENVIEEPGRHLSMSATESSESAPSDTDEDSYAVADFLDEIEELAKKHEKRLIREEEEALIKSLQENRTYLSQLKVACQATMEKAEFILQELLLPATAIHLLNVSFPGSAVIEYESSVTEEMPGERKKLKFRFDSFVYDGKERLKYYLKKLGKFSLTMWTDALMPLGFHHFTNLIFQNASEIEHQFPPVILGVRWLPEPESSFQVGGKNVTRCQRRFHKWLEAQDQYLSPSATVELRGMIMHRMNSNQDLRKPQRLYQQVVREEEKRTENSCPILTLHTLQLLQESNEIGVCEGNEDDEVELTKMEVTFDQDGYSGITKTDLTSQSTEDAKAKAEAEMWQRIISGCRRFTFWVTDNSMPSDLPREIHKYWAQRYRLFFKYDEGIKLDTESWYSVTPELLAAHQARRCRCEVVVDALCGAGGNAIQLAKTCRHVIAIDKDPNKVRLARHNAEVYGVAHRIEFRVGDFFKLAPSLKADVVYLSPPWGGIQYQEECVYDVYRLGGTMNCAHLLRAARAITPNVALYLPRNSNLCQVIALAGLDDAVDIEANYMGPKKKAITAYFGDLATKTGWC